MSKYHLAYQFRYDIDVEADSAEEAVAKAQEIDWNEWDESWTGPYVEFGVENLLTTLFYDMGLSTKKGEEDE